MKTNSDREYLILFINYLQIKFHKRLTIKKKEKKEGKKERWARKKLWKEKLFQ